MSESRRQTPSAIVCLGSCNRLLREIAEPYLFYRASGAAGTCLKHHVRHVSLRLQHTLLNSRVVVDPGSHLPRLESLIIDAGQLLPNLSTQVAVTTQASSVTFRKFHADLELLDAPNLVRLVFDLSRQSLDLTAFKRIKMASGAAPDPTRMPRVAHVKIILPDGLTTPSWLAILPELRTYHLSLPFANLQHHLEGEPVEPSGSRFYGRHGVDLANLPVESPSVSGS